MSELLSGDFVSLTPLSAAFVRRFDAATKMPDAVPPESAIDAYARGRADGHAAAAAERANLIAVCARIADAVSAFDAPPPRAAAATLASALTALVTQICGDAPVDPELLTRRCAEALDMAKEAAGPVRLLLAVQDCDALRQLFAELHPDLTIVPDLALTPGTVRVEHDEGAVVHGTATLLADLVARWQGGAP